MLGLAVASLSFDGFANNDFKNTFHNAAGCGYRYAEFNCWYADTLTPQKMRELRRRCEIAALVPIALHVSSFGGETSEQLALNTGHKLRAIAAARELGCRRVVASGMARGTAGGVGAIIRQLEILAPEAESQDVLLCLENHCENNLGNTEEYQAVLGAIPSRHVGVCLDTGHLEADGVAVLPFIYQFHPRIVHLHLKENNTFGKKEFCPFGEGTTDHDEIIRKLLDYGYSGYMTVELSPEIGRRQEIGFSIQQQRRPVELFSHYQQEGDL